MSWLILEVNEVLIMYVLVVGLCYEMFGIIWDIEFERSVWGWLFPVMNWCMDYLFSIWTICCNLRFDDDSVDRKLVMIWSVNNNSKCIDFNWHYCKMLLIDVGVVPIDIGAVPFVTGAVRNRVKGCWWSWWSCQGLLMLVQVVNYWNLYPTQQNHCTITDSIVLFNTKHRNQVTGRNQQTSIPCPPRFHPQLNSSKFQTFNVKNRSNFLPEQRQKPSLLHLFGLLKIIISPERQGLFNTSTLQE